MSLLTSLSPTLHLTRYYYYKYVVVFQWNPSYKSLEFNLLDYVSITLELHIITI